VYPRTSSVRRDHESCSRSLRVARPLGVAARRGRRAGTWQQRQCLQGDGCDCWAERSRASGPGEEVPGDSGAATTSASAASGAIATAAAAASGAIATATAAASGSAAATAAAASGASAATTAAASGSGATATAAASGSGAAATAAASGSGAAATAAASSAFKPAVWAASGAGRGVRGSRWRRETGRLLE